MKTIFPVIFAVAVSLSGILAFSSLQSQTCTVQFQANLSAAGIADPGTVGIRGSKAPLSWTETTTMTDPDGDGIYTLKLEFKNFKPGEAVLY